MRRSALSPADPMPNPDRLQPMKIIDQIASDPRVQSIHDEGSDGIWVMLKPGWIWKHGDTHALHERELPPLRRMVKHELAKCGCEGCRSLSHAQP